MKPGELTFSLDPLEDPDWGYARTRRLLLRRASFEYCQSGQCVPFGTDGLVCPNRDYPYEGLSAVVEGENWKFLDTIAIGLSKPDGTPYELVQQQATACPWETTYRFNVSDSGITVGTLSLSHYLMRSPKKPTLCIQATCDLTTSATLLRLVPLADLRFMYSQSNPGSITVKALETGLAATAQGGKTLVVTASAVLKATASNQTVGWRYKLGSGERQMGPFGISFKPEERPLVQMGEIICAFSNRKVQIQCQCYCGGTPEIQPPLRESRTHDQKAELLEQARTLKALSSTLSSARTRWGKDAAVALGGRASVLLTKFDYSAAGFSFPDAGAFWFRNAWMRDAFESAYTNFPIFLQNDSRRLRSWVVHCLQLSKDGLVPNKLPESASQQPSYAGLDGTLLCFLVWLKYAKAKGDAKLKSMIKFKALDAITCFKREGNPVRLHGNGLLSCPAAYGWVDSYHQNQHGQNVPSRLPESWAQKISEENRGENTQQEYYRKRYFLAETNALWTRFLKEVEEIAGNGEDWARELVQLLEDNYMQTFWKDGFVSHIADAQTGEAFGGDVGEGVESSMGITSAALLPEVIGREKLAILLENAKPLLVYRGKKLFGTLVRNSKQRIYFDDLQYHQAVVWPRDTPYLIKLLDCQPAESNRILVEELLLSGLEHQMYEGAVFYNHELFSLPEGTNPSPVENEMGLPVPVKNPAQLWSQWVQPYVDYLGG
jgi:hypothetical protein